MQRREGRTLFSASDLVGFLGCDHRTTLDLKALVEPLERARDDESAQLVQRKGFEHEAAYLASLQERGLRIARIDAEDASPAQLARMTLEAMRTGADIIFQAAFFWFFRHFRGRLRGS